MLGNMFNHVLSIVVPVVRLQSVSNQGAVQRSESIGRLFDQFHEIRRQHDYDAEAVVDRCSAEGNHRDGLATLDATVEESGWVAARYRCGIASYCAAVTSNFPWRDVSDVRV